METEKANDSADDDADAAKRRLAVKLFESGAGCTAASKAVGIGRQTAIRWRRVFKQGGAHALLATRPAGRPPSLSDAQCAELLAALSRSPAERGMGTGPWAIKRVAKLIRSMFGVEYSDSNVSRILLGLGAGIKDVRQLTAGPSPTPGPPR